MKNLKRLLSVLIVVAMLVTAMLPASAASSYNYEDEARALYDLGLYAGISKTEYQPDLGSKLTREQGVVLLVRFMGAEDEANALSEAEADTELTFFKDKASISSWAKKSVAYALRKKWVSGFPDGTFKPQGELLGKQFATMYLVAMGYTPDSTIYQSAAFYAANLSTEVGGITLAEASAWNDKVMTRDDAVGFAFGMLSTKNKDGKTLASILVEKGVVTADELTKAGAYGQDLYDAAVAAVEAYEAINVSKLATVADCDNTETTKKAATDAIEKVTVDSAKKALESRVNTKAATIAAIKANLEKAVDETAVVAAAEKAVAAYEATTDYANSESLKLDAVAAVGQVKDEAKKKAFMDRITARSADIAAIVAATSAVDEYLKASYGTSEQIAVAENLEKTANEKIALVKNETVKADLTKKVADRKALVDAKKTEIVPAKVTVTANNLKTITLTFDKPMAISKDTDISKYIKLYNVNSNNSPITFGTKSNAAANDAEKATSYYLSDDKKVLTLVYDYYVAQSTSIKVVITNLQDESGIKMSYEGTVTAVDQTIGQMEIQSMDAYTMTLKASEPVQLPVSNGSSFYAGGGNNPLIKIDGTTLNVKSVVATPSTGTIELEFYSVLSDGQHTVDVSGIRDYAGFELSSINGYVVSTKKDTTPPTVISAEAIGNSQVVVKFSEKIAAGTTPFSVGTFALKQFDGEVRISRVDYKDDTVTLTLTDKLTYGATVMCKLTVKGVADSKGNKLTTNAEVDVKVDAGTTESPRFAALPTVLSQDDPAAEGKVNMIKLTFSIPVDISSFVLYDKDGNVVATNKYAIKSYNTDNPDYKNYVLNIYDLTDVNKADGSDKTYQISGVKSKGILAGAMDKTSFTVKTVDNTAPKIQNVVYEEDKYANGDIANIILHVYFTEKIDVNTASQITNYYLGASNTAINQVLPADATIVVNNHPTSSYKLYEARITIPNNKNNESLINSIKAKMTGKSSDKYYIAAVNVKDASGNAIQLTGEGGLQNPFAFSTYQDAANSNTKLYFNNNSLNIRAKGTNTIEIESKNNHYFSSISKNDFSLVAVDDSKNIVYTIPPSDIVDIVHVQQNNRYNIILKNGYQLANNGAIYDATTGIYRQLYLVVTGDNTKDQYGLPLTITEDIAKNKKSQVKDSIAPYLVKTTIDIQLDAKGEKPIAGHNTVTLEFSEDIYTKSYKLSTGNYDWVNNCLKNADTSYGEAMAQYQKDLLAYYQSNATLPMPTEPVKADYGIETKGDPNSDLAAIIQVVVGGSKVLKNNTDYTISIDRNKIIITLNTGLNLKSNGYLADIQNISVRFDKSRTGEIFDALGNNGLDHAGLEFIQ